MINPITVNGVSMHRVEHMLRYTQRLVADQLDLVDGADLDVHDEFEFEGVGLHALFLADLTYAVGGTWMANEVNGHNGARTSTHGADMPRVTHELETVMKRSGGPVPGSVLLRCWSPDTRFKPEIGLRAAQFAAGLHDLTRERVDLISTNDSPRPDAISVVYGDIPLIADDLHPTGNGGLTWKGAPVACIFNQNMLAELARRTQLPLDCLLADLNPGITQNGTGLEGVAFDKCLQQDLFNGTTISAVPYTRVRSITEAVDVGLAMATMHRGAFIKPDAASGGTFATPVDPNMTADELVSELAAGAKKMEAKYGSRWETTCPIACYGFIHAVPVVLCRESYRWDLRFAVYARPDRVTVVPLTARVCPTPIGVTIDGSSAVTNVTGRRGGEVRTLTAQQVCEAARIDPDLLAVAAEGLYGWTRNAIRHSMTS